MYHPYFQGKPYELEAIRDRAQLLADMGFVPVIEPERQSLDELRSTVEAIHAVGGKAILIVNPFNGDNREFDLGIKYLLSIKNFFGKSAIRAGILLREETTLKEAESKFRILANFHPTFIHAGFAEPERLAGLFADRMPDMYNVFLEDSVDSRYLSHFEHGRRILVRDGFRRLRDADYSTREEFSDLHVKQKQLGINGFGDFLATGDRFSENGRPANSVAIHLTFIDTHGDDAMYIYRFVADKLDTTERKFGLALAKLTDALDSGKSQILETSAVKEFRRLHASGEFPGLDYVKMLSIRHHIETLSAYVRFRAANRAPAMVEHGIA